MKTTATLLASTFAATLLLAGCGTTMQDKEAMMKKEEMAKKEMMEKDAMMKKDAMAKPATPTK